MTTATHPEQLFSEDGTAMMLCERYTRGQAIAEAIYEMEQCARAHVGIYFRDFTASRRYLRQHPDRDIDHDYPFVFCEPGDEGAAPYWWVRKVRYERSW